VGYAHPTRPPRLPYWTIPVESLRPDERGWLGARFFGIVPAPVAGERVPVKFNMAAAEGAIHPESLRQKDRNPQAIPGKNSGERGLHDRHRRGSGPLVKQPAVISQVPRTEG